VRNLKSVFLLMLILLTVAYIAWAGSDTGMDATKRAADQGDVSAQHGLGLAYFSGQGVPQDLVEAVKWFRKAAENGYAASQYMLGVTFMVSDETPKDYVEATKWFRLAADQGFTDAQCMVSAAYATGRGVQRDYVLAFMWSSIAATRGDKDASKFRDELAPKMTPEEIARAKEMAQAWKPKPQQK
jgi:uncharacterized protein